MKTKMFLLLFCLGISLPGIASAYYFGGNWRHPAGTTFHIEDNGYNVSIGFNTTSIPSTHLTLSGFHQHGTLVYLSTMIYVAHLGCSYQTNYQLYYIDDYTAGFQITSTDGRGCIPGGGTLPPEIITRI
ncbi:MAG: hypothetical protein HQK53_17830 [Oligoflexia bacterium]|nr:hypothetical protein [Oligoflexia bacterium]